MTPPATTHWTDRWRAIAALSLFMLASGERAHADTWLVERDGSGHFSTLQPALDAASEGNTILVGPGEYIETTVFPYENEHEQGDTYAGIQVDNLTIIGSSVDEVLIGPSVAGVQGFLPKGMATRAGFVESIRVQNLTVRNVHSGLYVGGVVVLEDVRVSGCQVGAFFLPGSSGAWRRGGSLGSQAQGALFTRATNFHLSEAHFADANLAFSILLIESVGINLQDCTILGSGLGVQAQDGSSGTVRSSRFLEIAGTGAAALTGSTLELIDTVVSGTGISVGVTGRSRIVANGVTFAMSSPYTLFCQSESTATLNNCDITPSTEDYTVVLNAYDGFPSSVTLDLTNNYWGTTDSTAIADGIFDGHDDPNLMGWVEFAPFREHSIPTRVESMGRLKNRFRN